MYESRCGWPPVVAQHYRTSTVDGRPQCGTHVHCVHSRLDGSTRCHEDRFNPDCPEEFARHMRTDFWGAHRKAIVTAGAIAIGFLGTVAVVHALSR
jgi:hypothetical protein